MSVYDDEFFVFGVMPMFSLRNARFGDIDRNLSPICGADDLGETAALITVHFQIVSETIGRQIGKVGRVEFLLETSVCRIGERQCFGHSPELVQQFGDLAERNTVRSGDVAVVSFAVFPS